MKIFAAGATGAIGRPLKNRCNYDSSGLRLLAVAKYEGLPPWGLSTGFATWRRRDYVLYPAPLPHRQCFWKTQEHAGEFKDGRLNFFRTLWGRGLAPN
jgi:hypothetical protein